MSANLSQAQQFFDACAPAAHARGSVVRPHLITRPLTFRAL